MATLTPVTASNLKTSQVNGSIEHSLMGMFDTFSASERRHLARTIQSSWQEGLFYTCIHIYPTQSVVQVVSQKQIPTQIRQLNLNSRHSKGYVDGFVGELTSAKQL